MEPTTTAATPTDGVTAVTQPVEGGQPTAGAPTEPTAQTQPEAQVDDTAEWLSKKGYDPSDPDFGMKIAKSYREAEKLALKATEEASELRKSLTPDQPPVPQEGVQGDPMMQEFVQDYRRDKLINGFKESHPDWSQHEPAMVEILSTASPSGYSYRDLVNGGVIGLETVYAMAKASAPNDTTQVKQQAQQEVLQTLANTQRAGGGNAHASNSNPQAQSTDPVIEAIRKSRG